MRNNIRKLFANAMSAVTAMEQQCDLLAQVGREYVPTNQYGEPEYDLSCLYISGDGLCFSDGIDALVPVEAFFNASEEGLINHEDFLFLAI